MKADTKKNDNDLSNWEEIQLMSQAVLSYSRTSESLENVQAITARVGNRIVLLLVSKFADWTAIVYHKRSDCWGVDIRCSWHMRLHLCISAQSLVQSQLFFHLFWIFHIRTVSPSRPGRRRIDHLLCRRYHSDLATPKSPTEPLLLYLFLRILRAEFDMWPARRSIFSQIRSITFCACGS